MDELLRGGRGEEATGLLVRLQELLDLPAERGAAGAGAVEVGGPRRRVVDVQGGLEDGAFVHGGSRNENETQGLLLSLRDSPSRRARKRSRDGRRALDLPVQPGPREGPEPVG